MIFPVATTPPNSPLMLRKALSTVWSVTSTHQLRCASLDPQRLEAHLMIIDRVGRALKKLLQMPTLLSLDVQSIPTRKLRSPLELMRACCAHSWPLSSQETR
jgi:hypothetical protein